MMYILLPVVFLISVGFFIRWSLNKTKKDNEKRNAEFAVLPTIRQLIESGFIHNGSNQVWGKHKENEVGVYYHWDRYGTEYFACINGINLNGVKEIMSFNKTYKSDGFVAESKTGFRSQLPVNFSLKDVTAIFEKMTAILEQEKSK